jgi:predicted ABC-type ATPase
MGGAGSGKSTVAQQAVRDRFPDREFLHFDFDNAIAYHPLGPRVFQAIDSVTDERAEDVGASQAWHHCVEALENAMFVVFQEILREARYNLVVHGRLPLLWQARRWGYHTVLLFVAVPRKTAQARMKRRIEREGREVSSANAARMWERDRWNAPFAALTADEAWVADNRENRADPIPIRVFDCHSPTTVWEDIEAHILRIVGGHSHPGEKKEEEGGGSR